jgi:uncharacterized protein DUF481
MRAASLVVSTIVASTVGGASALAQTDPKFAYGSKEEAAELEKKDAVEWKAAAQAGLLFLTGNSRVTTFSAGASASRKANKNKFALEAGAAYARSSIFLAVDENANGTIEESELTRPSQTTTRSWMVKGRYDRYLTENNSLYGAAGLLADRPAGKELVANGQVGYSRQLYKDEVHLVLAEAGYDYTYENLVVGDGLSIHSLRTFGGYQGKLRKDTGLEASLEALFNLNTLDTATGEVGAFEDNRLLGKLALTTKATDAVSFRFGFEVRVDSAPAPRPPLALPYAPGFVPLADEVDTKTEAALIVSFL